MDWVTRKGYAGFMNTIHFWQHFTWMFTQGFGILGLPKVRLAFLLLIIGLFASIVWQRPFERGHWKNYYWLVLTQLVFYPAIIAIGTLYGVSSNPTRPLPKLNPFADLSLDVLFGVSLVSGIFWVCRMKGLRWFAFCMVLLQQLLVFGALFIASMSITGDWL